MDHCEPCGHRSPMIENQINFPSEWLLSKPKPQTAPGVAPVSNSCLCDWAGVTRRRLLKCARAFTYSETHTWFHECWLCLWRVNLFKTSLHTFFLSDVRQFKMHWCNSWIIWTKTTFLCQHSHCGPHYIMTIKIKTSHVAHTTIAVLLLNIFYSIITILLRFSHYGTINGRFYPDFIIFLLLPK